MTSVIRGRHRSLCSGWTRRDGWRSSASRRRSALSNSVRWAGLKSRLESVVRSVSVKSIVVYGPAVASLSLPARQAHPRRASGRAHRGSRHGPAPADRDAPACTPTHPPDGAGAPGAPPRPPSRGRDLAPVGEDERDEGVIDADIAHDGGLHGHALPSEPTRGALVIPLPDHPREVVLDDPSDLARLVVIVAAGRSDLDRGFEPDLGSAPAVSPHVGVPPLLAVEHDHLEDVASLVMKCGHT